MAGSLNKRLFFTKQEAYDTNGGNPGSPQHRLVVTRTRATRRHIWKETMLRAGLVAGSSHISSAIYKQCWPFGFHAGVFEHQAMAIDPRVYIFAIKAIRQDSGRLASSSGSSGGYAILRALRIVAATPNAVQQANLDGVAPVSLADSRLTESGAPINTHYGGTIRRRRYMDWRYDRRVHDHGPLQGPPRWRVAGSPNSQVDALSTGAGYLHLSNRGRG